jgi:uronate dehydrogenase
MTSFLNTAHDDRLDAGMTVQAARIRAAEAAGGQQTGWKAGFGTKAGRSGFGLDAPLVGALLEATRDAGVKRFIYASSHHVMGLHRSEGFDALSAPLAPDAYYGLGKAFGELACSLFAHRYGIHTLVLRIGNADPSVADERALRIWTSAADLAQLVSLGLSAGDLGLFEIAYGGSICPDPIFPRDPVATRLGYTPRDRALDHLAPGYLERSRMPPSLGPDFVGGAYAAVPLAPLHDQEER